MIEILEKLTASRASYLSALADIGAEEAIWQKDADSWSILQCAEHVANVEHRLFRTIQNAPTIPLSPPDAARENRIFLQVGSRDQPIPAPQFVRPVGRYATLAEAAEAFAGIRDRAIAFLRNHSGDLRAIGATHPILGPCNGYEYALIMAAHPIRHSLQIREIRQAYSAR